MRSAKRLLLCQSILAELQRLIARYSHNVRSSLAAFYVTAVAGKVMTFFFVLDIVARTSGASKFFSKECGPHRVQVCKCGPQH